MDKPSGRERGTAFRARVAMRTRCGRAGSPVQGEKKRRSAGLAWHPECSASLEGHD